MFHILDEPTVAYVIFAIFDNVLSDEVLKRHGVHVRSYGIRVLSQLFLVHPVVDGVSRWSPSPFANLSNRVDR